MKKNSNGIIDFLKPIISFLDKWLITPITKGILRATDFVKNNGKEIEKFINNKQTLIVISLIFAFIVFYIVDQNSNVLMNQSAEILYNQKVVAEYNEEAYVIEGLPKSVDITLIGNRANIYLAKQYPTHEVSVDLRDLKPGSHKVTLKYNQALPSIDYKLDPSTATIVVYEKVSETRELTYDVLHRDSLDTKLVLSDIHLNRSDVIIKGAEYKLKQVATVKALVDINNISNPKEGKTTLKDIALIAYDADGQQVDVEIVPTTVEAELTITSPSKEIPIKVVPNGEVALGKAISSLTTNVTSVIVYGEQDVLDDLEYLPVEIDVENLDKNKEYNINLKRPAGVREMSVKTVLVKLTLDDVATKEFKDIHITPINLPSGYKVQAATQADGMVTVMVKGSQSAIDALDASTIRATVDLSNMTSGTREVEVHVTGGDLKLTYESMTKRVTVKIEEDK